MGLSQKGCPMTQPPPSARQSASSRRHAERSELQRQGAKAAARGDPPEANPIQKARNQPDATGESRQTWLKRCEAWAEGFDKENDVRAGVREASAEPDDEYT